MYLKSKENRVITGLLEAISSEVTIVTAIHNIKANKGSKTAGVDKNKMDKYLQMPKECLVNLIQNNLKNYKPKPAKRMYIKKENGKERPLGIPTILDRIIQECVRIIIEPICEAKFYPHSYGFRPYRAQKHAVKDITHKMSIPSKDENKPVFALEGDIKGCFDNINHRILLQKLWKIGIHDKRVISIIKQMLKSGYIDYDIYCSSEVGTQQGGIISPLLSNVYLNDFDWFVGRQYCEPHRQCTRKGNDIRRLRNQGKNRKFNIRYADDWIILTSKMYEAQRLKKKLTKYFKHRLKLELSEEKTKITDMRVNGAEFLGFVIRAEKARGSKTGNLVGKAFPNMQKLNKKITNLCNEIHVLKKLTVPNTKIAQIHYINSVIMGIAEYIKSGICSKAFRAIDIRINHSCYYTWKHIYPNAGADMRVKMKELNNLPHRHEKYNDKTFAIKQDGMWIGVTKAYITHSAWEKLPFNEKMTPYTEEGRTLYVKSKKKNKPLPKNRPSINTSDELKMAVYNKSIYNFEYYMNREYAFNRDKGKCRCCGENLMYKHDKHCHHVNKSLELNKINKVSNLAWVCASCHYVIHSSTIPENVNAKVKEKILKFQEVLKRAEFVK